MHPITPPDPPSQRDRHTQQTIATTTSSQPPPETPAPIFAYYNRSFDLQQQHHHHHSANHDHPHKRPRDPYYYEQLFQQTPSGLANISECDFEERINWSTFAVKFAAGTAGETEDMATPSMTSTATPSSSVNAAAAATGQPLLALQSVPNFKVRISDEWGRRINSIESPGSEFFADYDAMGVADRSDAHVAEAFGGFASDEADDDDDDNVAGRRRPEGGRKCCSDCMDKCGGGGGAGAGSELKLQFSSSFE